MSSFASKGGVHEIRHNPGYDFLRLSRWMDQADPSDVNLPFAPYMIGPIGILASCCAFEGYLSMVGMEVDREWEAFVKTNLRIKERIKRVYSKLGKSVDFGHGNWQQLLDLIDARNSLAHPSYAEKAEFRNDEIPDLFEALDTTWPAKKSREVSERAIIQILTDAGLLYRLEHARFRMYLSK